MKRRLLRTSIVENAAQNVLADRCHRYHRTRLGRRRTLQLAEPSTFSAATQARLASSSSFSTSAAPAAAAAAKARVKVGISPTRTFVLSSLHWVLMALFVVVLCGGLLPVSQQTKQKFCGKSLTEAMDLACVNGYNDKISSASAGRKREVREFPVSQEDETNTFDLEPSFFLLNTYELSPFVAGMYAKVMATGRRRRNIVGVYDECCRKACSYSELSAYCRSPN